MTWRSNDAEVRLLADVWVDKQPTRSLFVRLVFLVLTSLGSLGIYFGYNMIGATTPALQAPPYNMDGLSIGSLAAAYSFPNVILPFFGGLLTDKLGVRFACTLYSGIVALGAFGLWVSLSIDMDHNVLHVLMMGSMFVFGVGGESTTVAEKAMLASWFKDSEGFPRLAFATGATLTFGYLGIIFNRWSVPALLFYSVPAAFLMSLCVCSASFLALATATWIHKYDERTRGPVQKQQQQAFATELASSDRSVACEVIKSDRSAFRELQEFAKRLTELPKAFFAICAMLSISAPLFASFETFGPAVMVEVWGYDLAKADEITSIAFLAGIVLVPSFGVIYDRCDGTGRGRIYGASLGCIIFGLSWLALTNLKPSLAPTSTPYLGTLGIALGASMFFGGTWPCVPLLVDESRVGTAFGIMTAIQNIGLSIALLVYGMLRDATGSFAAMGILFACQATISTILGLLLCYFWRIQQTCGPEKHEECNAIS